MIKQNEIEFVENKETNYYDNKYNEMSEKIIEDMNLEPYFKHLAKDYNEKMNKTEEKFWNKTNLISFYVLKINNVLKEYKNKPFKKSLESIINSYKVTKI